jgi:hypothetical protein
MRLVPTPEEAVSMNISIRRFAVIGLLSAVMAGLMAGSALAATPAPTTNAASGVGVTTATLNGSIQTGGVATLWQFQYGTSTKYGKTTKANTIPAGGGTVVVSSSITGLTANKKYHFRLVVQTGTGTSYYPIVTTNGADRTFTTKKIGKVIATVTKLKIKNGATTLGLKCSSLVNCKGKFTMTARVKVGKKHQNITFANKSFSIKHGKKSTLKFKLSGKGLTALKKAHGRKLKVKLLIKFSTHQPTISKTITLFL